MSGCYTAPVKPAQPGVEESAKDTKNVTDKVSVPGSRTLLQAASDAGKPTAAQREFLLTALILVAALLVYIPAMQGGFFWDDHSFLVRSELIHARDGLRRFWLTTEAQDYFPLTSTMLWIEWRLWGAGAAGYHVVNVLLHAAAAVLVWRVLRRLNVPGAWLAGMLFAVHPVAAASAAWITEGKNTLPMALGLLSVMAWLTFEERAERPPGTASRAKGWYALAIALFLLALLAKTSVVMLPAVLLLCAWWRRGRISGKDLLRTVPFFALSLGLGLVTMWFQKHNVIGATLVRPEGICSRLAAAGWMVWFYLFKLLLPAGLCVIYPRWEVDGAIWLAFAPLAILAAGLALLWLRRREMGPGAVVRAGVLPHHAAAGARVRGHGVHEVLAGGGPFSIRGDDRRDCLRRGAAGPRRRGRRLERFCGQVRRRRVRGCPGGPDLASRRAVWRRGAAVEGQPGEEPGAHRGPAGVAPPGRYVCPRGPLRARRSTVSTTASRSSPTPPTRITIAPPFTPTSADTTARSAITTR